MCSEPHGATGPARPARLAGLCLLVVACAATAEPFVPATDGEILERIPTSARSRDPDLRRLHRQAEARPGDPAPAAELARHYLRLARRESDPRYTGHARAALRPWWEVPRPPLEIQLLRARVHQAGHAFAPAMEDLEAALAREPHHAQALLTRALIHQVRGELGKARRDCAALVGRSSQLVVATCGARVAGLAGAARGAYRALGSVLTASPGAGLDERRWALAVLAELGARLGEPGTEAHFRRALALDPGDVPLRAAYADWLLDRGRPEAVLGLVADAARPEALLLQRVLAERRLGHPAAPDGLASLRGRLAAVAARGDTAHRREAARVELHLSRRPTAALALARENWSAQREPEDARILLEAALAAGAPAAARPVLAWLETTGLEDETLRALADRARGVLP